MGNKQYWENSDINYLPEGLAERVHSDFDLVVIDDFFDEPNLFRQQLMELDFQAPPSPKSGVISYNAHIPGSISDEIKTKIEEILGKEINFHPRSKCAMTFKSVPLNSVCHVDGGNNMEMFNWTVIIYMNPPEQCQGGTYLYQHIGTGDIHNKRGLEFYAEDFTDNSKWKLLEEVEMKYNRALLCPAWRFHSIAFTFGDGKENARLTINPKVYTLE